MSPHFPTLSPPGKPGGGGIDRRFNSTRKGDGFQCDKKNILLIN